MIRHIKLRRSILLMLAIVLASLPGDVCAQQAVTAQLSGYAKELAIRSRSFFTQKPFFYNVNRFRLQGQAFWGDRLKLEGWLDSEVLSGNFLQTLDFTIAEMLTPEKLLDLDWEVKSTEDYLLRQRLFRLFAVAYVGPAQITVGRQRIAWGSGFAWNPTDLLNPYNPFAIEREEKDGVDAVHVAIPLGALSRMEVAVAPGKRGLKPRMAARITGNFSGIDFALMAGEFQGDQVVGGDGTAYVGGAAVRVEWAVTRSDRRGDYLRFVANTDYNFPGDFYVMAEYYFNGAGTSDKSRYNLAALMSGNAFGLARHYTAGLASKNLTPLLRADLYWIANLNDRSALVGPMFTYSLAQNLELSLAAYLFSGAEDTELGAFGSSYFGVLQWYF